MDTLAFLHFIANRELKVNVERSVFKDKNFNVENYIQKNY